MKKEELKKIVKQEVFLLLSGKTIRQIATELNMSKSTVHFHLHRYVITTCGIATAGLVQYWLDHNFSQKHIRGGQANRKRWQEIRSKEVAE